MVKISEVAQHAGVSMSTVSYVLSGKRSISASTQRRVEASILALGYLPHAGARALASSRTNVLALVVPLRPGEYAPVNMLIATAVVATARRLGYDVLLLTQDEGESAIHRAAQSALVDGFIVMDIKLHDERLSTLHRTEQPSVLMGIPEDPEGLTCVDFDFRAAGQLCAEHFAELGHRTVALVGMPRAVYKRETGFASRVAAGFTEAADKRGLRSSVHACEATLDAARAMAGQLIADDPELTAVFIHNEPVVEPIVAELQRLGRRIPEDMSVVTLRPSESASNVALTPLTCVPLPAEELGALAAELLVAKLDKKPVPALALLPPRIGESISSAPPPGPPVRRQRR